MAKKLGTITWEKKPPQNESGAVPTLKKFCFDHYPKKDKTPLNIDIEKFSTATHAISTQFGKFSETISTLPLLAAILVWAETLAKDKFHTSRHAAMMQDLISHGYIGLQDTHGHVWTLQHMVAIGHDSVIEAIRCNEMWTAEKTEDYVRFYVDFVNWLSEKTLQYVPRAVDPDLEKTRLRKIPHSDFIIIAKALAERERIIAELIYFGGGRTLEQVLSFKIEDINFEQSQISTLDTIIQYPKHVLKRVLAHIGARKKGYIFIGRNTGTRLDGTVPYRALKTVISKLHLDPYFTFKDFVDNI